MEAWRNRWVRFPTLLALGAAVAVFAAVLFHPHYLDLCNRVKVDTADECQPMPLQAMIGVSLAGLGFMSMILFPIVASLAQVVRGGYDWETSRAETAVSNLPILAGFLYVVAGGIIALAVYR